MKTDPEAMESVRTIRTRLVDLIMGKRVLRHVYVSLAPVVFLLLVVGNLSTDLFGDEYKSLFVCTGADFLKRLLRPEMSHPPLFFIAARLFHGLVGQDWAIRIPSLLSGLATTLVLPCVAIEMFGMKRGAVAAWLTATSPFLAVFAVEGRPYGMLIFFSVGFLYALCLFLKHESKGTAIALAVFGALGLWTHYSFVSQLLFAVLCYAFYRRRLTKIALGTVLAVALACVALFLFSMAKVRFSGHSTHAVLASPVSIPNFLGRCGIAMTFGYSTFDLPSLEMARNVPAQAIADNWQLLMLASTFFLSVAYACFRLCARPPRWFWLTFTGTLLPVVLTTVLSVTQTFVAREKYCATALGCYLLLLALLFSWMIRSWWGRLGIGCYAVVVVVSLVHWIFFPYEYSRREMWTGLTSYVEAEARDGDCVIVYSLSKITPRPIPKVENQVGLVIVAKALNESETATPEALVESVNRLWPGRVFLIDREMGRNMIDPEWRLHQALGRNRSVKERKYGRNLRLYTFQSVNEER